MLGNFDRQINLSNDGYMRDAPSWLSNYVGNLSAQIMELRWDSQIRKSAWAGENFPVLEIMRDIILMMKSWPLYSPLKILSYAKSILREWTKTYFTSLLQLMACKPVER